MKRSRLARILRIGAVGTTIVAILQEVRKAPEDRQWHGKLGFVPYDFRVPTPSRIRQRLWNPDDDRILIPQLFGVGWGINLGRVARLLRRS
jgi:Family of unknown function (DUF5808)